MAASATARAIFIARAADSSLITTVLSPPQLPLSHHLLIRPLLLAVSPKKRARIFCLISGVGGGGVSDEFVSTRKSGFGREFSVISDMMKRIEPLDNSTISKGVSDSAKDSMKQTISTMLGLLPSDRFSVTVRVAKHPLYHLIVSSIVTGYTLWNAEYRTSLMHNFDISPVTPKRSNFADNDRDSVVRGDEREDEEREKGVGAGIEECGEELEKRDHQNIGKLSREALSYIQQLESEFSSVKKELYTQKQETLRMENINKSNNDLLEYLRSLESDVVSELSRLSSPEVEEVIHQLAQNTLRIFFSDDIFSDYLGDSALNSIQSNQKMDGGFCDTINRDYLAKLLFWCMLLGHHLRGLENRLHLSCVIGLL